MISKLKDLQDMFDVFFWIVFQLIKQNHQTFFENDTSFKMISINCARSYLKKNNLSDNSQSHGQVTVCMTDHTKYNH